MKEISVVWKLYAAGSGCLTLAAISKGSFDDGLLAAGVLLLCGIFIWIIEQL